MAADPSVTESSISSNDLRILDILANAGDLSQRQLAQRASLSVGMINLLLRRLALTGCIKVINLDRRKVRYMLTAKGMREKAIRSYHYLVRSLRAYHYFQDYLELIINKQIELGQTQFVIDGEGEIAELFKVILQRKGNAVKFRSVRDSNRPPQPGLEIVLNCNLNNHAVEGISVLEELLNSHSQSLKGESYELV